jgi:hypothetical protein
MFNEGGFMQAATNYIAETAASMERAVLRMQPTLHTVPVRVPLPATAEEITHYIENLLTDEEQRICDMATD